MRRLTAALGAIVLIATMTAAPVAAAKPQPTFQTSVCSYTTDLYRVQASWSHVHGVHDLAIAGSNSSDFSGGVASWNWVNVKGASGAVDAFLQKSTYSTYTYLWVGLLNHQGAWMVAWQSHPISTIAEC